MREAWSDSAYKGRGGSAELADDDGEAGDVETLDTAAADLPPCFFPLLVAAGSFFSPPSSVRLFVSNMQSFSTIRCTNCRPPCNAKNRITHALSIAVEAGKGSGQK